MNKETTSQYKNYDRKTNNVYTFDKRISDFQVPRHCESSYHSTAGKMIFFCETCNIYLCSKCKPCVKKHDVLKINGTFKDIKWQTVFIYENQINTKCS